MTKYRIHVAKTLTGILIAGIGLTSWSSGDHPTTSNWLAPKEADKLTNPLVGQERASEEGKKLFKKMCAICHGGSGKGDGIAGMSLNPRPADLTTQAIQDQSDGALYWKITEGRAPMASYKTSLSNEQRWQLVNYIRTFK